MGLDFINTCWTWTSRLSDFLSEDFRGGILSKIARYIYFITIPRNTCTPDFNFLSLFLHNYTLYLYLDSYIFTGFKEVLSSVLLVL